MKILYMKLGKEIQCHITKQLVYSFSVNIRISQPSKVSNPDVSLKRMHQLYNAVSLRNKLRLDIMSSLILFLNEAIFEFSYHVNCPLSDDSHEIIDAENER